MFHNPRPSVAPFKVFVQTKKKRKTTITITTTKKREEQSQTITECLLVEELPTQRFQVHGDAVGGDTKLGRLDAGKAGPQFFIAGYVIRGEYN